MAVVSYKKNLCLVFLSNRGYTYNYKEIDGEDFIVKFPMKYKHIEEGSQFVTVKINDVFFENPFDYPLRDVFLCRKIMVDGTLKAWDIFNNGCSFGYYGSESQTPCGKKFNMFIDITGIIHINFYEPVMPGERVGLLLGLIDFVRGI